MYSKALRKIYIVTCGFLIGILGIIGTYYGIAKYNKLHTEFLFVYKVLPVLIILDPDHYIIHGDTSVGSQMGAVLLIEDVNDPNTLRHELIHVKQQYRTLFMYSSFMYWTNAEYRLRAEYEAYAAEQNTSQDVIIDSLYNYYNLGMTKEQITSFISSYN